MNTDLTTAEMRARLELIKNEAVACKRVNMVHVFFQVDDAIEALDLAAAELARREREEMALNGAWRCSCCGELMEGLDGSWRWNGTVWQHSHGEAGHFDARNFSDSPVTNGGDNK